MWFDQFRILSTGPLIVQETHYDPWGVELSGLGYQYGGIKINPYLYNGKEANGHLGVNIYDFGARLYDPAIGRWFVSDPMAEKMRRHSPYNFAFNNPLRYIDPDGMEPYEVMGSVTTSGESESQEDETEKSVVNEEETAPDNDFLWSDGYSYQSARNSIIGRDSFNGSYQKYVVGADLKDNSDNLFENLLAIYDYLMLNNGLTRTKGIKNDRNIYFHITDFIKNIPIHQKGDSYTQTITSESKFTSQGIKYRYSISPAQVANPGQYYNMGYISKILSNSNGSLGQISLMNGNNTLFTLSIYGRQNFVERFNKIYKGNKIIQ
ncbi:RHS repeat domain-containing protein [Algoriphagus aquimarinus]|uniref:RHS repeat domain-containing protein n=1 Tax=Algoriphagus aquimarinus TaxID=237018 RepID=UPI001CB92F9D|nr:RHS repeat-associated core domain-containing protein [Algoriphagus aquimarinus]